MLDSTLIATLALLLFAGFRSHWTGRLLVLLLLSPVLRYGLAIFGFTIRLWLSAWAGALLRGCGMDVRVEGNVLVRQVAGVGPVEMAVDPACMGLHLTGLSVLVAAFFLMWHERRDDTSVGEISSLMQRKLKRDDISPTEVSSRRVPLIPLLVYGIAAFGLTIVCNLMRIILLVTFSLGPDSPLHEGIGLVCVAVYAWLPTWWLARWTVRRFGQPVPDRTTVWSPIWGLATLAVGAGLMAFTARPATADLTGRRALIVPLVKQGFVIRKITKDGFYQLTRPGSLLYVKPLPDWWSAEHSPAVCWRGGGYDLRRVQEKRVGHKTVYMAELRHPNRPTLYTAWWFTNGPYQTISQLDFRWRMARGEPGFSLVNITAEKPFSVHQIGSLLRLQRGPLSD